MFLPESVRALLEVRRYDVALADYVLPGRLPGLALRSICEDAGPSARFALMSALPEGDLLREAAGESCPFLAKPFTVPQCRSFLEELLASSVTAITAHV